MNKEYKLIKFILGEEGDAKDVAEHGDRLNAWAGAFDVWAEAYEKRVVPDTFGEVMRGCRYFFSDLKKVPWEITAADAQEFVDTELGRGIGAKTLKTRMARISQFYDHCARYAIDAPWNPDYVDFNPAADYALKKRYTRTTRVLSYDQLIALLAVMKADTSMVGLRNLAMVGILLGCGGRDGRITRLQWKDFIRRKGMLHVNSPHLPGRHPRKIPRGTEDVLNRYLKQSGRMAVMKPEDYVFAPLRQSTMSQPTGNPDEWDCYRPISMPVANKDLKRYARKAGLDERQVSFYTLYYTAIALRVVAGGEVADMAAFVGNKAYEGSMRTIHALDALSHVEPAVVEAEEIRNPGACGFKRWDQPGLTHGFYAGRLPEEDYADLDAAAVEGLREEIDAMRIVMRRAVGESVGEVDGQRLMRLVEVFGLASTRLGKLLMMSRELEVSEGDKVLDALNRALTEVMKEMEKNESNLLI